MGIVGDYRAFLLRRRHGKSRRFRNGTSYDNDNINGSSGHVTARKGEEGGGRIEKKKTIFFFH